MPLFRKGDGLAKFRQLYSRLGADIVAVNQQEAEPLLLLFNPDIITEVLSNKGFEKA